MVAIITVPTKKTGIFKVRPWRQPLCWFKGHKKYHFVVSFNWPITGEFDQCWKCGKIFERKPRYDGTM